MSCSLEGEHAIIVAYSSPSGSLALSGIVSQVATCRAGSGLQLRRRAERRGPRNHVRRLRALLSLLALIASISSREPASGFSSLTFRRIWPEAFNHAAIAHQSSAGRYGQLAFRLGGRDEIVHGVAKPTVADSAKAAATVDSATLC